jgi:hypothetical protein
MIVGLGEIECLHARCIPNAAFVKIEGYACRGSFSYGRAHRGYVVRHISMTKIKGEPVQNPVAYG